MRHIGLFEALLHGEMGACRLSGFGVRHNDEDSRGEQRERKAHHLASFAEVGRDSALPRPNRTLMRAARQVLAGEGLAAGARGGPYTSCARRLKAATMRRTASLNTTPIAA